MTPGRSAEVARELAPDRVTAGTEREITVDHSNDCVVVDEAVFVKWLTPPPPVPHRGIDMLAHLAAVGFEHMPELLGVVREPTDHSAVVALVFEHIAGGRDGWEWFFEEVLAVADGTGSERDALRSAERIGALAAELHVALSVRSNVIHDTAKMVSGAVERDRCRALLASALEEVRAADHPEAHAVLAACHDEIADLIEAMPVERTLGIPTHGDLHLGQVLRAGDRVLLIDFEGNPLTANAPQPPQRPAAVDTASVIQSIDHAVRMAQHRRPGMDDICDALAAQLADVGLSGYRRRLSEFIMPGLLNERLLPGLRAAQELHELVYAVRRLPRWIYAPTLALRGMFPTAIQA
jgi:maltokinase